MIVDSSNTPLSMTEVGQPEVLNGANIKFGPYHHPNGWTAQTNYVNSQITEVTPANGPPWNMVRINLDWPHYQIKVGSNVVLNTAAFDELDKVINHARSRGLVVVLTPITLRSISNASTLCTNGGASGVQNIPAWAWQNAGRTPNSCAPSDETTYSNQRLAALQANYTHVRSYLQHVAARYTLGGGIVAPNLTDDTRRTVVALDLVNEIKAGSLVPPGSGAKQENELILDFYGDLVDDVRAVAPRKILVAQPGHGDTSLALNSGDLLDFSNTRTNLVWSVHDYFAGAKPGATIPNGTFGYGRTGYGYRDSATIQFESVAPSYTHPDAGTQHRLYLEEMVQWVAAARLPVWIGEYGVRNPCVGGNLLSNATAYAQDTRDLYNSVEYSPTSSDRVALSRTWWVSHDDGNMQLKSACGGTTALHPYAWDT
jgi:hypothetical protein